MVLLLHEQRYSAYSLLKCQIFCLFDSDVASQDEAIKRHAKNVVF